MPIRPTSRPSSAIGSPSATGAVETQPAKVAVRLAPVVEAGHRLLADVAALREADGAVVDSGLLGDRRGGHLAAEPRTPRLHAQDLRGGLADALRARLGEGRGERLPASPAAQIRSMPRSVATARHVAPPTSSSRWACSGARPSAPLAAAARRARSRTGSPRPQFGRRSPPPARRGRGTGGARRHRSPPRSGSSQNRSGSSRRTRMSACMWPLRSSRAA